MLACKTATAKSGILATNVESAGLPTLRNCERVPMLPVSQIKAWLTCSFLG